KISIKGDYYYREDRTPQPAIEISYERPSSRVAQSVSSTPEVAVTQGRDAVLEQRLAALRGVVRTEQPVAAAAPARPAAPSNPPPEPGAAATEAAPLSAAMSDLLSHLDDTVGFIRSLKPGGKGEDGE